MKMIPKLIFQTSKAPLEAHVKQYVCEKLPDWEYEYFDDERILDYFRANPMSEFPNLEEKFMSFERGEHRADLFRYFYLFQNGGVFLDSDAMIDDGLKEYMKEDIVLVNSWMNYYNYRYIYNGFIMVEPRNALIYEALENCYNTDNQTLQKCYHYFCKELYRMIRGYEGEVKFFQEHNCLTCSKVPRNYGGSRIYDGKHVIGSHFYDLKRIPLK